jgi:hypothetical protein
MEVNLPQNDWRSRQTSRTFGTAVFALTIEAGNYSERLSHDGPIPNARARPKIPFLTSARADLLSKVGRLAVQQRSL